MDKENTISLPVAFVEKMKNLLGEEYEAFADSYEKERVQGLRFNLLKDELSKLQKKYEERFQLKSIPWCEEGFYYPGDKRPGKNPLHEAGVYYIQEPSAMSVVSLLKPVPGDVVLDLCAAPGGKSTQVAGRLQGKGFLISNEIHPARAKILSQNVERMGISNGVVTNEDSAKLAKYFPAFFDKIVVDAPCSGEGMFRKDEQARAEWSEENVAICAARQSEILDNAAIMLKPGRKMVYSTCTFSPEENEENIQAFLERHPDFSLVESHRIWPHKVEGEGHFLALLEKAGKLSENLEVSIESEHEKNLAHDGKSDMAIATKSATTSKNKRRNTDKGISTDKGIPKETRKLVDEFLEDTFTTEGLEYLLDGKNLRQYGEQIYLVPNGMIDDKGLRVLRFGLHVGTLKKNRLEPSHALALAVKKEDVKRTADFSSESEEIKAYLSGQTLSVPQGDNGWTIVCTDGYPLGWGKVSSGILKNHYPKGLRVLL